MFSRSLHVLILALTVSSVFAGCVKLNESAPKSLTPELELGTDTACLSAKLPVFKDFVEGNATPAALGGAWDCMGTSLTTFKKFVRGASDQYYTPEELSSFIQKYFLKDVEISDALLAQVMKVKTLIVGGEEDKITKPELDQLIVTIQSFKEITLNVLPYMKLYGLNWKMDTSKSIDENLIYFQQANAAIQAAAHSLAAIVAQNGVSYDLQNVKPLLVELQKAAQKHWSFMSRIDDYLPLFYNLKATLAGGDPHVVRSSEWDPMINLAARGLIQFLRLDYFVRENPSQSDSDYIFVISKEVDDLMDLLAEMVSAKSSHQLTRAELLQDFQSLTQIFPVFKISDKFLLGAMQIKQLLFGGSVDYFTAEDFRSVRAKLGAIESIANRLDPYLPIYSEKWKALEGDPAKNLAYYLSSELVLESALMDLTQLFESGLDIEALKSFLLETNDLYTGKLGIDINQVVKFVPVLESFRQTLFGDTGNVIKLGQWPLMISGLSKVLGRALQYYYFVYQSPYSYRYRFGLEALNSFVVESLNSLNVIIQQKSDHQFSVNSMVQLAKPLGDLGYLPSGFRGSILPTILKLVTNRLLLSPENRLAGRLPNAINTNSVLVAQNEWQGFYSVQKYLADRVFADSDNRTVSLANLQSDFSQSADLADLESGNYSNVDIAMAEMKAVFATPVSRALDDKGRLAISFTNQDYKLDQIQFQNYSRILGRLILRSYGTDLERIKTYKGIVFDEWDTGVKDFEPILIATGLFAEFSKTFSQSRFIEMNLFTPRADGDDTASFIELSDFVLNIFSGLNIDVDVTKAIAPDDGRGECALTGTGLGRMLSVSCMTEVYHEHYDSFFESMPIQAKYVSTLKRCPAVSKFPWILDSKLLAGASKAQLAAVGVSDVGGYLDSCQHSYDVFLVNLVLAAGWVPNYDGMMKVSDATLMPHALQYVESLMQRFDAGHTGLLDTPDMKAAYPLLKPTLQYVTKNIGTNLSDTLLRGLLAYLMEYGKPPATDTIIDKAKFWVYAQDIGGWDIHTDRALLGAILGTIADAVANAGETHADVVAGAGPQVPAALSPSQP